jgi:hypothetical protein
VTKVWTVEKIKGHHEKLYAQLIEASAKKTKVAPEYLLQVRELLEQIQARSTQDSLTSEYTSLVNATQQWQVAFSTLMEIDADALQAMPLSVPKAPRLVGPDSTSPDEEIQRSLAYAARCISLIRRTREAKRVFERLSSPDEENSDWYHAEVLFATQVTEGDRDLLKVPPQSFVYLENAWFRDVIQLKAYFLWEQAGADPEADSKIAYYQARQFYRDRLADPGKRSAAEFVYVGSYLKDKYLDDRAMRSDPRKTEELKHKKARQFCEARHFCGPYFDDRNWYEASRFVETFYDHITPAIRDADPDSLDKVWEAIALSEGDASRLSIINGFEASIVLYFLRNYERFPGAWR